MNELWKSKFSNAAKKIVAGVDQQLLGHIVSVNNTKFRLRSSTLTFLVEHKVIPRSSARDESLNEK